MNNNSNGAQDSAPKVTNLSNHSKVQFVSKKQREELKLKQEEEEKQREASRLKEIEKKRQEFMRPVAPQIKRSRSRSPQEKNPRKDNREIRRRREDEESDHDQEDNQNKFRMQDKEVEMIKGQYITGQTNNNKKKVIKHGADKFKQVFLFDWDASEDTSTDINPLYAQKHDPKILFGKGYMGGVDQNEQQRIYEAKTGKVIVDKAEDFMTKPRELMSERDWRIFRENNDIITKGGRIPHPIRNWDEIEGVNEILRDNISFAGYTSPMPIQMQGVPVGMCFRDMIGLAPTGSGKSAAFLIPLINFLMKMPPIKDELIQDGPYSIIMAPTRELAIQIEEEFRKLVRDSHLRSIIVVGGKSSEEQGSSIGRGVEIVIGTPGRIEDLIKRQYLVLNQCYYVILDEADKMIDLELEESVNFILESIPANLQKSSEKEKDVIEQEMQMVRGEKFYKTFVMFSATMLPQVEKIARKYLRFPAMINIGEPGGGKKDIDQRVEFLSESVKRNRLVQLIKKYPQPPIIIFVRERIDTESLANFLTKSGFKATTLHGSKTQEQREKALNSLKDGANDILVCTNVAARGLDVEGVSHVINFHAPANIVDYTHRIGRTGRAGRKGMATTFISTGDDSLLYDLKKFMQDNDQIIPSELANHPAARFKTGQFAAIDAQMQPPPQKKGEYSNKAVPTSTQMNNR